jgi:hypothetical protein
LIFKFCYINFLRKIAIYLKEQKEIALHECDLNANPLFAASKQIPALSNSAFQLNLMTPRISPRLERSAAEKCITQMYVLRG